jgi:hypothetical protein
MGFTRSLAALILALTCSTAIAETQASKHARLTKMVQSLSLDPKYVTTFINAIVNVKKYDTAVELLADTTQTEGLVGYAIDTNAFYVYAGTAWVGLIGTSGVVGTNGGTLGNETNNVWKFSENSEDLTLTAGSNLWTFASGTSATVAFTPGVAFADALTLSDGLTIDQSANNKFTVAENSEDMELTFATNLVTFGSTTAATYAFTPAVSFTGAVSPVGGISTTIANGANAACNTTCGAKACITGFDAGASAFVACATATADTCLCGP